jgi:hypothetical protein
VLATTKAEESFVIGNETALMADAFSGTGTNAIITDNPKAINSTDTM